MTCTDTTNGDGDCGRRMCPQCGPDARAAAVQAEANANQTDTTTAAAAAEKTTGKDDGAPATVKVSISAFNRSVDIEAPGTLDVVSSVAFQLWQQTSDLAVQPAGALGFVMGVPSTPEPLAVRGLSPYDRTVPHAA